VSADCGHPDFHEAESIAAAQGPSWGFAETVGVRDSKDRQGPVLTFTPSAWAAFVTRAAVIQPVR
jgi:hypothetical protein